MDIIRNGLFFILPIFCLNLFGQNKETYTYAIKDGEELKLDIYYPENFENLNQLPTIVWMHGGGFSGGSRDAPDEIKFCEEITKRDFLAVSISYRLTRKGIKEGVGCDCPADVKMETFRKASEDYLDAVRFLVENQDEFGIDVEKMIAGGSSAGAEGVLNAVYMKNKWFGNKYDDLKISGILSLAGAVIPEADLFKENLIPTVFFHGAKDDLVPYFKESHHLCDEKRLGYFPLIGAGSLAEIYKSNNKSFFLFASKEGKHELSRIPFEYLDEIFDFFKSTIIRVNMVNREVYLR